MLGSYNDGPANSSASAGPFPMPEAIRPWIIGTLVRVAKYMNAPVKLAKKLDNREFPPTARYTHSLGMIPAMEVLPCVEPKRNPAVTTPMANKGRICFGKPHEANAHSRFFFHETACSFDHIYRECRPAGSSAESGSIRPYRIYRCYSV